MTVAAFENSELVYTHSVREYADALVSELWKHDIVADVVPSDRHPGEWDVLVPAHDAGRATWMVSALLARG